MPDKSDEVRGSSPYAGRWVARLQGRIIAHGGTPEQARLAAQKSRHKEKPEVSYMRPDASLFFPPVIEKVRSVLPDKEIYLVGGAVRDALLGRVSHDFDFAVPANAIGLARHVASVLRADFYVLDQGFDAARVIISNESGVRDFLDFSSYRDAEPPRSEEDDLKNANRQDDVTQKELEVGQNLDTDLLGRDFTINAMALDLRDQTILDPLGGATDLRNKTIRACSKNGFADDPIRILRAVRQAAAFEFRIEPGTRNAMKASADLITSVSPERQRDELFKILDGGRPAACLRALEMLGVFPHLLPEIVPMIGLEQPAPHVYDVWEHTLSVIEQLEGILATLTPGFDSTNSNDMLTGLLSVRLGRYRENVRWHFDKLLNADRSLRALLIFAALYHDIAKPVTRIVDESARIRFFGHDARGATMAATRARAFNLSKDEIRRIEIIIANHMRFHFHVSRMEGEKKLPSRKAIYRFFRDTGEAGVDLVLLGLADVRGTRSTTLTQEGWTAALDVARILLENYWEKPEESVAPARLVNGNEVMKAFSLEPGILIGEVLEAIREAQATGKIATRTDALDLADRWLRDHRE